MWCVVLCCDVARCNAVWSRQLGDALDQHENTKLTLKRCLMETRNSIFISDIITKIELNEVNPYAHLGEAIPPSSHVRGVVMVIGEPEHDARGRTGRMWRRHDVIHHTPYSCVCHFQPLAFGRLTVDAHTF